MWFLEAGIFRKIAKATTDTISSAIQQQTEYEAAYSAQSDVGGPRILSVAGKSAEIAITGVLTQRPSFMAAFFGGGNTTYSEINSALAIADRDDDVEDITLVIDSPGGQIAGLFDTLAAIEAVGKPITAVVQNMAASAAFAIASQADTIVAGNKASILGSIGVVKDFVIDDRVVSVTSSNASNKRPDVTTEEGKAVVREELDAIEEIFIDAIADVRGISSKKVIADFGQGGVFLANEALKRGMIDSIADGPSKPGKHAKSTTARSDADITEAKMDLEELKAKHPALYAAAMAIGATEATAKERDRVSAHLVMGQASGDMKTALAAVEAGSDMTQELQAKYMAAGMNRQDIANRQEDDGAAAPADDAEDSAVDADATTSDKIMALAFEACGVESGSAANAQS